MKAALCVAGLAVMGFVVVRVTAGASSGARPQAEPCSAAVYTSLANAPPKPLHAIRIGPTVFNSLANLTSPRGLGQPTKKLPFYAVKSPLTILARASNGVTIRLLGGRNNAALVYNRHWLQRLASWHYTFSQVPRSVRLMICKDVGTHRPLNTQFAGGFLLRNPTCVTIEVQAIGKSTKQRAKVPMGARC